MPYNNGVGAEDYLQPRKQVAASRALFLDQPSLRDPGHFGDNSAVVVGTMTRAEWLAREQARPGRL